jgi:hypothetical protein
MPSFDASFGLSFSDLSLEELGMRFLGSACCQACMAPSSSLIVYPMDEADANKARTVLTTPISSNKAEDLLAWLKPTFDGILATEALCPNGRGSR